MKYILQYCLMVSVLVAGKPFVTAVPAFAADPVAAEEMGWFDKEWQKFRSYPHLDKAYQHIKAGNTALAIEELEKLVEAFPQDEKTRRSLVVLLLQEKAYTKALPHVDVLLQNTPDSVPVLLDKVTILRHTGRDDAALPLLARITRLSEDSSTHVRVALESADIYGKMSLLDKAIAVLQTPHYARASVDERGRIVLTLVELQARNKDYAAALRTLDDMGQGVLTPSFRTLSLRASLLASAGRLLQAIDIYKQAFAKAESATHKAQVLKALGFLYAGLHDYAAAQTAFTQALGLDAADASLLPALGGVLYSQKHYQEAEQVYRRALEKQSDPALRIALARCLMQLGKNAAAATMLQTVTAPAVRSEALAALAEVSVRLGNPVEAAALYQEAYASADVKQTSWLLQAAQLYAEHNLPEAGLSALDAIPAVGALAPEEQVHFHVLRSALWRENKQLGLARHELDRALHLPHLGKAEKAALWEQAGYLAQADKDPKAASVLLHKALAAGRESQNVRMQLGFTAFSLKEYGKANRHFSHVLGTPAYAAAHGEAYLGLARVYAVSGKPGLAVESFQRAHALRTQHNPATLRDYYTELGASYAAGKRPAEAAVAYAAARELGADSAVDCAYGVVVRQAGQNAEALALWDSLTEASLNSECRALRHVERARLYAEVQDIPAALAQYSEATATHAPAAVVREQGTLLRGQGKLQEAYTLHQRAYAMEPELPQLVELAYDEVHLKRYDDAIEHMEQVLDHEPDYLALYGEMGYANKHLFRNAAAARSFRKAIDNEARYPVYTAAEQAALRREMYIYRNEVRNIENVFDASFVWSASTGQTGRIENASIARSASGLELAWTPPVIGFRDDRVIQVVGRAMWSTGPDTLALPLPMFAQPKNSTGSGFMESVRIPSEAIQGAAGVRAKPWSSQNIVVGVEKLFKLGMDSEDNLLFRLMGSWGSDIKPYEADWFYWSVFLEADYFAMAPARAAFTGEIRAGWTWNVNKKNTVLVTPHVVANAIHWTDFDYVSYREIGPGLSLRFLFNETKYETAGTELEFLLQYKVGETFNTSGRSQERNTHALFSTLAFRF